jgi:adenosylcobinamide hydrolase
VKIEAVAGWVVSHTQDHIHLDFSRPRRVLSSAVLNGGMVEADHLVNWRVSGDPSTETPEDSLARYCAKNGWTGTAVGMMTAASMDSFRMERETVQGVDFSVLVTSGLSNPRRAGDRAEIREMVIGNEPVGTINIVALTSAQLSEAAMVEALILVTEAKAAALQDAGIVSPVSGGIATGTGTDSHAIVSGHGPQVVRYCGKHVLFGEVLGRLVISAVAASINYDSSAG